MGSSPHARRSRAGVLRGNRFDRWPVPEQSAPGERAATAPWDRQAPPRSTVDRPAQRPVHAADPGRTRAFPWSWACSSGPSPRRRARAQWVRGPALPRGRLPVQRSSREQGLSPQDSHGDMSGRLGRGPSAHGSRLALAWEPVTTHWDSGREQTGGGPTTEACGRK